MISDKSLRIKEIIRESKLSYFGDIRYNNKFLSIRTFLVNHGNAEIRNVED